MSLYQTNKIWKNYFAFMNFLSFFQSFLSYAHVELACGYTFEIIMLTYIKEYQSIEECKLFENSFCKVEVSRTHIASTKNFFMNIIKVASCVAKVNK